MTESLCYPPETVTPLLIGYSPVQNWVVTRSDGKESSCNAGDLGLIPVLGSSPGEGKSYPLQYSGLENSIDCKVHGVEKSWTQLRDFNYFYSVRRKKWKNFIFIAFLPLGEGTNIQKCVIYTSIKVF